MPHDATPLVESLLHEIAGLLACLAATGQSARIDLLSLPIGPAGRAALAERLGRGEVEAALDAGGASEIWETGFSGVWWVRHFGADDKLATEQIEITTIPTILLSQPPDIAIAAARLAAGLAQQAELPQ
jgi:hydrogenase-1 operon protein HyaF